MIYHQYDVSFKLNGVTAGLMLCKVSANLIGLNVNVNFPPHQISLITSVS